MITLCRLVHHRNSSHRPHSFFTGKISVTGSCIGFFTNTKVHRLWVRFHHTTCKYVQTCDSTYSVFLPSMKEITNGALPSVLVQLKLTLSPAILITDYEQTVMHSFASVVLLSFFASNFSTYTKWRSQKRYENDRDSALRIMGSGSLAPVPEDHVEETLHDSAWTEESAEVFFWRRGWDDERGTAGYIISSQWICGAASEVRKTTSPALITVWKRGTVASRSYRQPRKPFTNHCKFQKVAR